MTTRRKFLQGAVSAAVAASLPGGDGVELYSAKHPEYTYKTFRTAREWSRNGETFKTFMPLDHELSERMVEALCRSMMQTKEIVAANVFHRGFPESDALRSPLTDDLFVEIPEVHRS